MNEYEYEHHEWKVGILQLEATRSGVPTAPDPSLPWRWSVSFVEPEGSGYGVEVASWYVDSLSAAKEMAHRRAASLLSSALFDLVGESTRPIEWEEV